MSDLPVSISCEMVSSGLCAVRGVRNISLILGNTLVVSYFLCTLYEKAQALYPYAKRLKTAHKSFSFFIDGEAFFLEAISLSGNS